MTGKPELVQAVIENRRHASGLEYDPTTAWRFRQFAGDSPARRPRSVLQVPRGEP